MVHQVARNLINKWTNNNQISVSYAKQNYAAPSTRAIVYSLPWQKSPSKTNRTLARCPNQVGKLAGQVLGRIIFVEANVFLVCQNILVLLSLFISLKAVERRMPLLVSFSRITEPAKYQKDRTVLLWKVRGQNTIKSWLLCSLLDRIWVNYV